MYSKRLLDVLIPSYNRPARLFKLLDSGLKLNMEGVFFIVIDDCSNIKEHIDGLGIVSTEDVCLYFKSENILCIRNNQNIGLARSWVEYYKNHCHAKYTMSIVDKDIFIDSQPILSAIQKLEKDESISLVVIPMYQEHRGDDSVLVTFDYMQMSGKDYVTTFINDVSLQHCSSYGLKRVASLKKAGVPRDLELRSYGLDDGFGIDIDIIFKLAITGNVAFEQKPHVMVVKVGGGTELYPLTFAYTYYQYTKRVMNELVNNKMLSESSAKIYIKNWLILILRGLIVSYQPVHGTELENGTTRIRRHLKIPIHIYLILEAIKYKIWPSKDLRHLFTMSLKVMIRKPFRLVFAS